MPTITKDMIDAARQVLARYAVAEEEEIKPADVTDEMIDAYLEELREIDEADRADNPELPSLDDIFAEMLTAALNAAVTS